MLKQELPCIIHVSGKGQLIHALPKNTVYVLSPGHLDYSSNPVI